MFAPPWEFWLNSNPTYPTPPHWGSGYTPRPQFWLACRAAHRTGGSDPHFCLGLAHPAPKSGPAWGADLPVTRIAREGDTPGSERARHLPTHCGHTRDRQCVYLQEKFVGQKCARTALCTGKVDSTLTHPLWPCPGDDNGVVHEKIL